MPLLPQRRKAKGEPSRLPVLRSVSRLPLGMGWPLYFCSIGLGSNVSTWEGPPLRKRKMTCLAVAVKCGALGAIGAVAPARVFVAAAPGRVLVAACCDASRIPASPAMPKPVPMVRSICRRDGLKIILVLSSVEIGELIGTQQDLGVFGPRAGISADEFASQPPLFRGGIALEHEAVSSRDALVVARCICGHASGEGAGLSDDERTIHEEELLQRDGSLQALLTGAVRIRKIE